MSQDYSKALFEVNEAAAVDKSNTPSNEIELEESELAKSTSVKVKIDKKKSKNKSFFRQLSENFEKARQK